MSGFESSQLNELQNIIKRKDDFIELQGRDIDALKREIKQLRHTLGRFQARKK